MADLDPTAAQTLPSEPAATARPAQPAAPATQQAAPGQTTQRQPAAASGNAPTQQDGLQAQYPGIPYKPKSLPQRTMLDFANSMDSVARDYAKARISNLFSGSQTLPQDADFEAAYQEYQSWRTTPLDQFPERFAQISTMVELLQHSREHALNAQLPSEALSQWASQVQAPLELAALMQADLERVLTSEHNTRVAAAANSAIPFVLENPQTLEDRTWNLFKGNHGPALTTFASNFIDAVAVLDSEIVFKINRATGKPGPFADLPLSTGHQVPVELYDFNQITSDMIESGKNYTKEQLRAMNAQVVLQRVQNDFANPNNPDHIRNYLAMRDELQKAGLPENTISALMAELQERINLQLNVHREASLSPDIQLAPDSPMTVPSTPRQERGERVISS